VNPVLERRLVVDHVHAKASELALIANPRVREPDRRHQVAMGQHRQHHRVDLVCLAGQRSEPLDLLRIGDLDIPAHLLERVVDEPGAGHRLDHGADRLAMDLVDPAGQPSERIDVRRDRELVEVLSPIREEADVELSSTQV
jgi:hypothetical protein